MTASTLLQVFTVDVKKEIKQLQNNFVFVSSDEFLRTAKIKINLDGLSARRKLGQLYLYFGECEMFSGILIVY